MIERWRSLNCLKTDSLNSWWVFWPRIFITFKLALRIFSQRKSLAYFLVSISLLVMRFNAYLDDSV